MESTTSGLMRRTTIAVETYLDKIEKSSFAATLTGHPRFVLTLAMFGCLAISALPIDLLQPYLQAGTSFPLDLRFISFTLALSSLGLALLQLTISGKRPYGFDALLLTVLSILLTVHASAAIVQFWKAVTQQIAFTWTEETIFLFISRADNLVELYSIENLSRAPFAAFIYAPGAFVVMKGIFAFVGDSLVSARYISILSVFTICVLLLWLTHVGRRTSEAIVPPLMFLAVVPTMCWVGGTLGTSHFFAAAFAFGGFGVYLRHCTHVTRIPWLLLSAGLLSIAVLGKQTVIAAAFAISVSLIYQRRFSALAAFAAGITIAPLASYLALWVPTEGGVWHMTITANAADLDLGRAMGFGAGYLFSGFVLIVVAMLLMTFVRPVSLQYRLTALYTVIALPMFFVAVGRPGGSHHYFLESAIAGTLLLGFGLKEMASTGQSPSARILLLGLIGVFFLQLFPQFAITARAAADPLPAQRLERLLERLPTDADEYILSTPEFVYTVSRAGQHPLVLDGLMHTVMINNNVLSDRLLLDYIERGSVPFVLLRDLEESNDLPASVIDVVGERYSCTEIGEDLPRPILCSLLEDPVD